MEPRKTKLAVGAFALLAVLAVATAGAAVAHANGMFGGRHDPAPLTYEGDPASGALANVARNGTVLFERVEYAPADVKVVLGGPGVGIRALNATTVTLTLPAGATVVVHEAVADWSPAGATVTYADGGKANLVLRNGTLAVDGSVLTLSLEAGGGAQYGPAFARHGGFGFGPLGDHGPMHGGRGGHGGPRGHR